MDAMRARRQRDVETIVDDDPRRRPTHLGDRVPHDLVQLRRRKIGLANLHPVDARIGRSGHVREDRETAPIGDGAEDGRTRHGHA